MPVFPVEPKVTPRFGKLVVRCEKSQKSSLAALTEWSSRSGRKVQSHRIYQPDAVLQGQESFHFRYRLTVNQSEGSVSMFPTALALRWLPLFPLLFKNLPSQQHSEHLNPFPRHDLLFGNQRQMAASEKCFQLCCDCDRHFVRNTRSVENRMIKKIYI